MKKDGDIYAAFKEVIEAEGLEKEAVIEWADVLKMKPATLAMELLEMAAGKIRSAKGVKKDEDIQHRDTENTEKSEGDPSVGGRAKIRNHFGIPEPGDDK